MPRRKMGEEPKPFTVYLYKRERNMVDIMVATGQYHCNSDMIRQIIIRDYNDKFPRGTQETIRIRDKELEDMKKTVAHAESQLSNEFNRLMGIYSRRRKQMILNSTYEANQKQWISDNLRVLASTFPNKDLNEIFEELETRCEIYEQ